MGPGAGGGTAGAGAAAKAGLLGKAALGLKTLFVAGKFTTVGTMGLSVVAYASLFGPSYAVGLALLTFIHEMGHYGLARAKGIPVSAPMFIPFVGAYVVTRMTDRSLGERGGYVALVALGLLGMHAAYVIH